MRVLMLTVGSRGDVEPYGALAHQILSNNHDDNDTTTVDFFVQPELQALLPTSNEHLRVHTWPFTQQDFYAFVRNPTHGANHENPRVRFVGVVADTIASLVFPCANRVDQVAATAQIIVTSALARSLAMAVGAKHNIPVALVHLQPLVPTNKFPHYSRTEECVKAILAIESQVGNNDNLVETPVNGSDGSSNHNKDTYVTLERFQHDFLQEGLDSLYKELNLPDRLDFDANLALLCGKCDKVGIFNCFSSDLIPDVATKKRNVDGGGDQQPSFVYNIGGLADPYIPPSFEPGSLSGDLLDFLKRRPICVGYGSMPFDRVAILLDALQAAGKPALLVGQAMRLGPDNAQNDWVCENIRQVDTLPYAWLLPQCSMMLSHGGAGVLHTTLRAGIPPVITPFMGDQFSWAQLVQAKGLGVQAGSSLPAVTQEDIQTAIQRAETECTDNAKAFGRAMRNHTEGTVTMQRILKRAAKAKAFSEN